MTKCAGTCVGKCAGGGHLGIRIRVTAGHIGDGLGLPRCATDPLSCTDKAASRRQELRVWLQRRALTTTSALKRHGGGMEMAATRVQCLLALQGEGGSPTADSCCFFPHSSRYGNSLSPSHELPHTLSSWASGMLAIPLACYSLFAPVSAASQPHCATPPVTRIWAFIVYSSA
jgi:hypothetical protein